MAREFNIAAIDIGSNAIRLALAQVHPKKGVVPLKQFRQPIRLGKDAFSKGWISNESLEKMTESFRRFRKILRHEDVVHLRAVATSALREAKNRMDVLRSVSIHSGISVEVISGEEEAQLIHLGINHYFNLGKASSLLIDMGGGSLELSESHGGKLIRGTTFPLGTVRLLEKLKELQLRTFDLPLAVSSEFEKVQAYLKKVARPIVHCVGTGGNLRCLGKLRKDLLGKRSGDVLLTSEVEKIYGLLSALTEKERRLHLKLNRDRADVIIPSTYVVLKVLYECEIGQIHVPPLGLKDGILVDLAQKLKGSVSKGSADHLFKVPWL